MSQLPASNTGRAADSYPLRRRFPRGPHSTTGPTSLRVESPLVYPLETSFLPIKMQALIDHINEKTQSTKDLVNRGKICQIIYQIQFNLVRYLENGQHDDTALKESQPRFRNILKYFNLSDSDIDFFLDTVFQLSIHPMTQNRQANSWPIANQTATIETENIRQILDKLGSSARKIQMANQFLQELQPLHFDQGSPRRFVSIDMEQTQPMGSERHHSISAHIEQIDRKVNELKTQIQTAFAQGGHPIFIADYLFELAYLKWYDDSLSANEDLILFLVELLGSQVNDILNRPIPIRQNSPIFSKAGCSLNERLPALLQGLYSQNWGGMTLFINLHDEGHLSLDLTWDNNRFFRVFFQLLLESEGKIKETHLILIIKLLKIAGKTPSIDRKTIETILRFKNAKKENILSRILRSQWEKASYQQSILVNLQEAIYLLIEYGVDLNNRDHHHQTPLMDAVLLMNALENEDETLIQMLLDHGANHLLRNHMNKKAVHFLLDDFGENIRNLLSTFNPYQIKMELKAKLKQIQNKIRLILHRHMIIQIMRAEKMKLTLSYGQFPVVFTFFSQDNTNTEERESSIPELRQSLREAERKLSQLQGREN